MSGRRIVYVVNQYPKVSHSFIRREIVALERLGLTVQRVAMRGWDADLVDPADVDEVRRTRYVLRNGWTSIPAATLRSIVTAPLRLLRAARLASAIGLRTSSRGLLRHWIYLGEACVVAGWARAVGANWLHAHFGTNSTQVAMLASLISGLPYSFTVHGPEEFDRADALALGEKIRRADAVVAISSFGRSQLYRWVDHAHWHKLHVVHCGLDAADLDAVATAPPSRLRLVCVGRLCEQKGQLLLLQAMGRLVDRGLQFELVLAGDGEMREPVEALARQLGLDGAVRITGWLSGAQVRQELLEARALVLPSFAEGLPVVLMEAMALNRPVISTYVAGIPELVEPGRSGWLVPAGDVEALATAMQDCLRAGPERLRSMGEAGRERVRQRHAIDASALRLAGLMNAAASG